MDIHVKNKIKEYYCYSERLKPNDIDFDIG